MPNAPLIIQYSESILPNAVHAATVLVPKVFSELWMMTLEILYIADCRPAGRPILRIMAIGCA